MKHLVRLIWIFLFLQLSSLSFAQNSTVEGLWMIKNVHVSNRDLTPVAKWTHIKADGTYESGNGWMKHSEGRWTFNDSGKTFLAEENNGIIDPYGAFTVSFEGKRMRWVRTEEGHKVTVTLARIPEIPPSPADRIQGLWDLVQVRENDKDVTQTYDSQNKQYFYITWDRKYMKRTPGGERQTGYWYMNAHKPELTLMNLTGEQKALSWEVKFSSDQMMTMTGISDKNREQVLVYKRLRSFPE